MVERYPVVRGRGHRGRELAVGGNVRGYVCFLDYRYVRCVRDERSLRGRPE